METDTLAARLGTTTHLSPLLHKARRLGLGPRELEILAIQRGCDYYHHGSPLPPSTVAEDKFSNLELAIALLHPGLRYSPHRVRLGAAMLSAKPTTPADAAHLAHLECAERVVHYVAEAGTKFEPGNLFWSELLQLLKRPRPLPSGVLPHPTRFVAMTGMTRRGVETVVEWIRPIVPEPAHG